MDGKTVTMDPETMSAVTAQLDGLTWCLFSGAAAAVYAGDERAIGDLDIGLAGDDIDTFADRLGATVEHRSFEKNGKQIEDEGFTTTFNGVEIEAVTGFPRSRVEDGTFQNVFEHRTPATFHGQQVYLSPIEDLFILKAYLFREKDRADLERLNDHPFDRQLLLAFLADWQVDADRIRANLATCGITV